MSGAGQEVVVVTATYRRPAQLAALLQSLASEAPPLRRAVVVDNAATAETRQVAAAAPVETRVLAPGANLGCGGGVALGLREAWRDPATTHAWIFDDDAEARPGALRTMLDALAATGGDAAVPLVTDAAGHVGWFPGPLTQPAWDAIRRPRITAAEFRARAGLEPLAWRWAPWPSLLVTRRAVEAVGYPRNDYWFQGEDLEWTLRLSARLNCILVPAAECRHLPPPARPDRARLKHAAMLQNNLFTATRLPHGRRALRHAPGNAVRFLRCEGVSWSTIRLLVLAHWLGAVRGRPAGTPGADTFQRRWHALG